MSDAFAPPPPEEEDAVEKRWKPRENGRQLLAIPRYLRVIGFSKLLIGLIVVALITVVIAMPLANREETGMRIILNQLPVVADTNDKPKMESPRYEGVDSKNRPYIVTAKEAIQEDITTIRLIDLKANITLEDGKWVALEANQGVLQITNQKLLLQGKVHCYSSEGNQFLTEEILVNLGSGDAWGPKAVQAQSPMGAIAAGNVQLSMHYQAIRFGKGVKLVVQMKD